MAHRHQPSLEGRLDFSAIIPVFADQQQRAPGTLVRLTFEYARSVEAQDKLLRAFFQCLDLDVLNDNGNELDDDRELAAYREPLFGFADHLINHFFLPLRAATGKTRSPPPPTMLRSSRSKPNRSSSSDFRKAAIAILNMFDVGVIHLIEGTNINRPYNAMTLSLEMHRLFGNFDIFFERVTETPHTYNIRTFDPFFEKGLNLPVRRTFFEHPSIDPPSERLLALHSAIGHVLHLSGAGEYIDRILRDLEDGMVREDGSTQLGPLVNLALGARANPKMGSFGSLLVGS
ncbi:hypothetical protein B0T16DRAFT_450731 [Cercophora newfieldiana]|uniref:HNH nuclease domain-containing protein n=1 Tax=Cercophora newfieldiana TaxID=92897 RepID=A0AA39YM74_9PEZI|nr:hypothetical protein B0T16DRAFT_450731 [Cercophora newfieldiana]